MCCNCLSRHLWLIYLIYLYYTLYKYSNIREFKNVGGMDTVGIVYNADIYTRLTSELTSKLGHIRTQQLLSTISDIHYEDCINQWWSSPATPYTTNTSSSYTNTNNNYTNTSNYNYNTSNTYNTSSNTNDTSSNYTGSNSYTTNTSNNSYISTSSYISIFDNQQEQQARIHEFISFIRYCTNNTTPTTATTTTSANNSSINNTTYTNDTPIIIGHSLFFKLFYSARLSELLKHTRPELYNMLYNAKYKLTNCSVLVLSILFSHDNDYECIILDAEVLYGGGFELNGVGGIGGMGGGEGGRKRHERLSITSVGSRSRLSGGSERSSGVGESGAGAGGVSSSSRGGRTVAEGGVACESQNATTTADRMSSKKGGSSGGGGGLWDSLWGN